MAFIDNDYCFACGAENPIGLHLRFEQVEEKFVAKKTLAREFQGYSNVAHGGIVTTLLDEAMGNYVQTVHHQMALTGRIEVRYHYPTPVEQELTISAWQEAQRRNIVVMKATVQTADGAVTAEASAKFAIVGK